MDAISFHANLNGTDWFPNKPAFPQARDVIGCVHSGLNMLRPTSASVKFGTSPITGQLQESERGVGQSWFRISIARYGDFVEQAEVLDAARMPAAVLLQRNGLGSAFGASM